MFGCRVRARYEAGRLRLSRGTAKCSEEVRDEPQRMSVSNGSTKAETRRNAHHVQKAMDRADGEDRDHQGSRERVVVVFHDRAVAANPTISVPHPRGRPARPRRSTPTHTRHSDGFLRRRPE